MFIANLEFVTSALGKGFFFFFLNDYYLVSVCCCSKVMACLSVSVTCQITLITMLPWYYIRYPLGTWIFLIDTFEIVRVNVQCSPHLRIWMYVHCHFALVESSLLFVPIAFFEYIVLKLIPMYIGNTASAGWNFRFRFIWLPFPIGVGENFYILRLRM